MAVEREMINLKSVTVPLTIEPFSLKRRADGAWSLELDIDIEVALPDGRTLRFIDRHPITGKQLGSLPRGRMAAGMNGFKVKPAKKRSAK